MFVLVHVSLSLEISIVYLLAPKRNINLEGCSLSTFVWHLSTSISQGSYYISLFLFFAFFNLRAKHVCLIFFLKETMNVWR
ncbi:hypothetical protein HanRHA438_Chr12g0533331 [Helianthus annuus]|nr:hypothetical protein HanIR_Chr12g0562141 [Helianthus annuus]KAJ0864759.1 hypothetical protein HanRHA438_Chr12g0533331 [Helianthus annuus]